MRSAICEQVEAYYTARVERHGATPAGVDWNGAASQRLRFAQLRRLCPEAGPFPLLDYGFLRSDACQDTISVWQGQYFRREDHIDRFERSCSRLRLTIPYGRAEIRDILDQCCALTGFESAYLQMIMTRGAPPLGQRDLRKATNRFQLFCLRYVWIASPEVQRRHADVIDFATTSDEWDAAIARVKAAGRSEKAG